MYYSHKPRRFALGDPPEEAAFAFSVAETGPVGGPAPRRQPTKTVQHQITRIGARLKEAEDRYESIKRQAVAALAPKAISVEVPTSFVEFPGAKVSLSPLEFSKLVPGKQYTVGQLVREPSGEVISVDPRLAVTLDRAANEVRALRRMLPRYTPGPVTAEFSEGIAPLPGAVIEPYRRDAQTAQADEPNVFVEPPESDLSFGDAVLASLNAAANSFSFDFTTRPLPSVPRLPGPAFEVTTTP